MKLRIILILALGIIITGLFFKSYLPRGNTVSGNFAAERSNLNYPEEVVRAYFTFWREKNYKGMYALLSDGFKKLDPEAKSIESFTSYAMSQGIDAIEINSIKEAYHERREAGVQYEVVFFVHDKKIPYQGTFTLKYREEDAVPGWKMIHPYGDNIDVT